MKTNGFLVARPQNGANCAIFSQVRALALILHVTVECGAVKKYALIFFWNYTLDNINKSKTWLIF